MLFLSAENDPIAPAHLVRCDNFDGGVGTSLGAWVHEGRATVRLACHFASCSTGMTKRERGGALRLFLTSGEPRPECPQGAAAGGDG